MVQVVLANPVLDLMVIPSVKRLFGSNPLRLPAHSLYVKLVNQARLPVFYRDCQVPDTLDGRFDIIVLHLFLAISRLEEEKDNAQIPAFIRTLSETFFADMDQSLREMGASDTGVGIRVKRMAEAFYGRCKAYQAVISDHATLAEALTRNVWREQPVDAGSVAALAGYMQRNHPFLQTQAISDLLQGNINFID